MSHRPAKAALGAAALLLTLVVAAPASAATFTGTVTDASNNNAPLSGICVAIYDGAAKDGLIGPTPLSSGVTNAQGAYSVSANGNSFQFKVGFSDCANHVYATQFADNSPDLDGARSITAFGNQTVNAALTPAATMAGTIYAGDGQTPLPKACAVLLNGDGGAVATGSAGSDGTYSIGGVLPGSYGLRFQAFGCPGAPSSLHYTPQTVPGGVTLAAANPLTGIDGNLSADTTAPNVTILNGPAGSTSNPIATFAFSADDQSATLACSIDGGTPVACSSPWSSGSLASAPHTFSVVATDPAGNTSSAATRSWTVDPTAAVTTGGDAPAGGTLSSDPANGGTSAANPLVATVTTPNPGTLGFAVSSFLATSPPSGWSFFGREMTITAPNASPGAPLRLVFTVDYSSMPANTDPSKVAVFRDGSVVAPCDDQSGVASPDPCVLSQTVALSGNTTITVLSSHASVWDVGLSSGSSGNSGNSGSGNSGSGGGGGNPGLPNLGGGGTGGTPTTPATTATTPTSSGPNLGTLLSSIAKSGAAAAASPPATTTASTTAKAPAKCKPPTLKNHTLLGAKRLIKKAHCALGTVTQKAKRGFKRGRIYAQSARPGRISPAGRRINVIISLGEPSPDAAGTIVSR